MNQDTNREDHILNQCDGCRQSAPLKYGLHIDKDGHAFMRCQKERYEPDLNRVTCLSCGARAESAQSLPCGH